MEWIEVVITIVASVMASSGFWMFIMKKIEKNDARSKMLMGLGHDRIVELGMKYIDRGWITQDEHENLSEYLYKPYLDMKGNGSAERIMREVNTLRIRRSSTNGYYNFDDDKKEARPAQKE